MISLQTFFFKHTKNKKGKLNASQANTKERKRERGGGGEGEKEERLKVRGRVPRGGRRDECYGRSADTYDEKAMMRQAIFLKTFLMEALSTVIPLILV